MSVVDSIVEFVATPLRQKGVLTETRHRPWPIPERPWLMAQTWENLLFAHWSLSADDLRASVPTELPIDEFEGLAWVGVTPFRLTGLRARWTYPIPLLSYFPELNVRTYVHVDGKPGIYFFSLDAGSPLAVAAARRFYRLPYFWAEMAAQVERDGIHYRTRRRGEGDHAFVARYGPLGPAFNAKPGTLEHFLTERYCLYTVDEGVVLRAEIHHPPWILCQAHMDLRVNTMARSIVPEGDPLLHYAVHQDVLIWTPEKI